MQLLIVRHAIAEEPKDWAPRPDEARPLTGRGEREMREVARGLRQLVPALGGLLTSPYTRALQTAEIVAAAYDLAPRVVPELASGRQPHEMLRVLESLAGEDTAALVGHEPDLSELASLLLSGDSRSFIAIKKGGACLLQLDAAQPGRATLLWLLKPAQLRLLGAD